MKKAILGALALSAFSAVQASAITIDFSSNAWNPNGNGSHTVGNTTVTAVNPDRSEDLSWDDDYGLGVNSQGSDSEQIEENEYLQINFSQAFSLTSFSVARLFDNRDVDESGYYRLNNDGAWIRFDGTDSGNKTVILASPALVTSLQFGYNPSLNTSDAFFLKSLVGDFQTTQNPPSVPEPTSMVLLGTGLAGVIARARRKRA
jgi:hypothetical protein